MNRRSRKINITPIIAPAAAPEPGDVELKEEASFATAFRLPSPPRPNSKLGIVLGLLQADEGASLAKLIAVTDWQPHTTRAALTGLRKRGYVIGIDKVVDADGAKRSVYRITAGRAQ